MHKEKSIALVGINSQLCSFIEFFRVRNSTIQQLKPQRWVGEGVPLTLQRAIHQLHWTQYNNWQEVTETLYITRNRVKRPCTKKNLWPEKGVRTEMTSTIHSRHIRDVVSTVTTRQKRRIRLGFSSQRMFSYMCTRNPIRCINHHHFIGCKEVPIRKSTYRNVFRNLLAELLRVLLIILYSLSTNAHKRLAIFRGEVKPSEMMTTQTCRSGQLLNFLQWSGIRKHWSLHH